MDPFRVQWFFCILFLSLSIIIFFQRLEAVLFPYPTSASELKNRTSEAAPLWGLVELMALATMKPPLCLEQLWSLEPISIYPLSNSEVCKALLEFPVFYYVFIN